MIVKTVRISLRASPEEKQAIRELAGLLHCDMSTAMLQAVYMARSKAREDAQLIEAWEKAQEKAK